MLERLIEAIVKTVTEPKPETLLGIVLIVLYFVPWFIAAGRNHHNRSAIALLNLLLGWTAVGWIAALVWSCSNPAPAIAPQPADQPAPDPIADSDLSVRLSKLESLKTQGLISDTEYSERRAAILDEI